ncbi:peptidase S10 [Brevundimonas sp.]|uniref:S10 family serine carboxypeptidase-like protein n=1 Tax=Brevundimonas sp. TaxID=1871086 RepID=UPI001D57DC1A|nr:peptidase S10 [Brevundimonas sp.]MBA3999417.1 peptidase S10 [Brevundimonas sp.]
MIQSIRSLAAGLAVMLTLAAPAAAQDARNPRSVVTAHVTQLQDGPVAYQAVVAETMVRSEDGRASGTVVTTSYIRTNVAPAGRPVLFIFNGGPGASTTPLHFGAFGPMRRFGEGDHQYLAMNPHSLLDAADLVFIDPVGTGYSRPHDDGAPFWTRTGDARSVADVIRQWLARHERTDSPRYLLGQSYGTLRAAEIMRVAPDLEFDGVLLFALVPGERSGPLAHVSSLPSYAAAAWHHGRAARDGRTVEQVYEDAVVFARTDYIAALIQGAALPDAERGAMAGRLSAMTGLPAALIAENDLRITNTLFMFNLLADQGLRTGQLDARATARLDAPAQRPPYDDPGMNYGPEAVARPADPEETVFRPEDGVSVVDAYYADVLDFRADDTYQALNLEVNSAWDHEGFIDAIPHLAEAMARDPDLRVFWSAGYYDLSTPAYGGRYTLDQAGIPADRLTAAYFASGHSVFIEDTNLEALADAVRDFMAE